MVELITMEQAIHRKSLIGTIATALSVERNYERHYRLRYCSTRWLVHCRRLFLVVAMNAEERLKYIDRPHTGLGWMPLIKELNEKIETLFPDYDIEQIKEKFGALRYYIIIPWNEDETEEEARNRDVAYKLTNEYGDKSMTICESCGTTDNVTCGGHGYYWIKTLCVKCVRVPDADE